MGRPLKKGGGGIHPVHPETTPVETPLDIRTHCQLVRLSEGINAAPEGPAPVIGNRPAFQAEVTRGPSGPPRRSPERLTVGPIPDPPLKASSIPGPPGGRKARKCNPSTATPTATQASKCASRFLNRCLESNRKTSASRTTTGESSIHGIQSRKAASAASRQVRGAGLTAPLR